MAFFSSISSTFFLERYYKTGLLQLKPGDEFFPIDMGNDNYVAVKLDEIDKGKLNAIEIIRVLENVFRLRDQVDAGTLFSIFDKTFSRLNSRFHFHSEYHRVISMRVVLFYMLGLQKKGSLIDITNFIPLAQFIKNKAFEENVNSASSSIINILLNDSDTESNTSLLEFYKEKRQHVQELIQMQQAISEKIILPMAEILRIALQEGAMFFLGIEVAEVIFRILSGLVKLYRVLTAMEALANLTWLLKKMETLFSMALKLFNLLMLIPGAVDIYEKAKMFIKMFSDLLDGILQVFVFQDYTLDNKILFLEGVDDFSDEDDDLLFETLKEYPAA